MIESKSQRPFYMRFSVAGAIALLTQCICDLVLRLQTCSAIISFLFVISNILEIIALNFSQKIVCLLGIIPLHIFCLCQAWHLYCYLGLPPMLHIFLFFFALQICEVKSIGLEKTSCHLVLHPSISQTKTSFVCHSSWASA